MDTILTIGAAILILCLMYQKPSGGESQRKENETILFGEVKFVFYSGTSPTNKTCPSPYQKPDPAFCLTFNVDDVYVKLDNVRADVKMQYEWVQTKGYHVPKKWRCVPGEASTVLYGSNTRTLTFVPVGTGIYCFTFIVSYIEPEDKWLMISGKKEYCVSVISTIEQKP